MEKLAFVVLFICILAGAGLNALAWAQHKGSEDQLTPLHTLHTLSTPSQLTYKNLPVYNQCD